MQTDASTTAKELTPSSSSSSSDSSLDGDDPKTTQVNHDAQPASPEPPISMTESPPIQAMGRPGETKYRIPSHVFARTNKEAAAVEWSVASNESLFSIQMGTMSFIEDPLFSITGDQQLPTTSAQMFSYNPSDPGYRTTDIQKSADGKASEAAVETMMEVIRESEDPSGVKFSEAPSVSLCSDTSDASVKSFAFPVLTGDKRKDSSTNRSSRLRDDHIEDSKPPIIKTQQTHARTQTQEQVQQSSTETSDQPQQPKPSTFQLAALRTRWLACFPCCSCT